ncbi:MAG: NUDIX hydrolase [Candidatus Izemoplasmatales bacterium]
MYKKMFEEYQPYNEQEAKDKELIVSFIRNNVDVLDRENLAAHITASAFVVNQEMDKILFVYHKIYDSWSWVGGHNDGDPDLVKVAIKEAKEETGIEDVEPISESIFTIDVIYVPNHIKKGKYVPDHLHLNAAFLLIADENQNLVVNEQETSGVRWFKISEVLDYVSEPRMKPVYLKAFAKIEAIRNGQ